MNKIVCKPFACAFMLSMNVTALRADAPPPYDYQGISYAIFQIPMYFKNDKPWLMRVKTQEEWQTLNRSMWASSNLNIEHTPLTYIPSYDFEHYDLVMGGVGYTPCYRLTIMNSIVHPNMQSPGQIYAWGIPYPCVPGDTITLFIDSTTAGVLVPKTDNPITVYFEELSPQSLKVTATSNSTLN